MRNRTPTSVADRHATVHRRCRRPSCESKRMNSSGSTSDASVLRRAPVPEISIITQEPKAEPSVPTILAPLRTNRRVLFRCSGLISRLDQNWQDLSPVRNAILICQLGSANSISATRAVGLRPQKRRDWRLSAEPAKIGEPAWHYSATTLNIQSAPYRRPDPTSCRQQTGK
jgi:hypothetical protein